MPTLGKATYFLELNTKAFDAGMAKSEARAAAATDAIAAQMGVASKSVEGLGRTTAVTAGVVETSTGQMAMSFEEAGAAGTAMGSQVEAGAAKAATASEAAAAKTAFSWNAAAKKMEGIGKRMRGLGRTLTTKVTLPVALVGGLAAKMSLDFSKAMTNIQALVGASAEEIKVYRDEVLKLATEGPEGPKALAEALFFITSSGFKGAAALRVLNASALASKAGLGEVALIADAVTSAVTAYGEAALSAERATDIMVAAIREGKGEPDELAKVLGHVIAPAEQLGIEFDEVAAALSAMSLIGIDFFEGATATRAVMMSLIKPSKAAREVMEKTWGSAENLRKEIKERGLIKVLQEMRERFKDNKEVLAKLFPNVRAYNGLMALTGKAAGKTARIQRVLTNSIGDTARAADIAAKDPLVRLKTAWSKLQVSMIKLGDVVVPIVVAIVEAVTKVVDVFEDLPRGLKAGILVAVGLAAALGPLLSMLGLMAIAIGGLVPVVGALAAVFTGPGLLIAALVLLVAVMAAAVLMPDQLRAGLMKLGLSFEDASAIVDGLAGAMEALVVVVRFAIGQVVAAAEFLVDQIVGRFDILIGILTGDWKRAWDGFVRLVKSPLNLVKAMFQNWVDEIKGIFTSLWDGLKRAAFKAVSAIVEPFTHLPGFLGDWARKAKDAIHDELAKIDAERAAEAAEKLAENYGLVFVPLFEQMGADASDAFQTGFLAGGGILKVLPKEKDTGPWARWNARKGKWVDEQKRVLKDQQAAWDALRKKVGASASILTVKPGERVQLGGAPSVVPGRDAVTGDGDGDGDGEKKKKKKKELFPGFGVFPAHLQLKELRAAGTKWLGDDLKVMRLQMQYLISIKTRLRERGKLTTTKLLAIETEQKNIRDKIRDINERIREKMQVDLGDIPVGLRIRKTIAERTESLKDDISAATRELGFWRDLRKRLIRKHAAQEDIADVEEKITEALLRRRDLLEQQKETAEDINAAQRAAFDALSERAGFFGSFGSNIFTTAPGAPGEAGPVRTPGAVPERGFAAGGIVGGDGGADSVSARLSPGEGVLTRSTVTSIARDLGLQARTIEGSGKGASDGKIVKVERFVNEQHFNAPTTDRHREARYAKIAVEAVFDGVGSGEM